MATQLEGNITLGGTDYAASVRALVVRGTRDVTTAEGTFANASQTQTLGSAAYEVDIIYEYDETVAADLFWELNTAFTSNSGDLAFTANPTTGVTSATNPQWSGTLKINEIVGMGTVGEDKVQSVTFPAEGVAIATS